MTSRARPEEQGSILAEALQRVRAAAPGGVALFDLDSTLLDNRPRQARILRDYGRVAGLPVLRGARPEHCRGWDLEGGLVAAGLAPELARRHRATFLRFWAARFFTSDCCRLDVPVPGAPEFVRAVAAAGVRVVYVTARPARMGPGTLAVLARFGFALPPEGGARLLMKPGEQLGDDEWKERACDEVRALGPVAVAFDNEPSHVNAYARAFPGALTVHVDRDHSDRPVAVLPEIPSIRDFRLVAVVSAGAAGATAGAP